MFCLHHAGVFELRGGGLGRDFDAPLGRGHGHGCGFGLGRGTGAHDARKRINHLVEVA